MFYFTLGRISFFFLKCAPSRRGQTQSRVIEDASKIQVSLRSSRCVRQGQTAASFAPFRVYQQKMYKLYPDKAIGLFKCYIYIYKVLIQGGARNVLPINISSFIYREKIPPGAWTLREIPYSRNLSSYIILNHHCGVSWWHSTLRIFVSFFKYKRVTLRLLSCCCRKWLLLIQIHAMSQKKSCFGTRISSIIHEMYCVALYVQWKNNHSVIIFSYKYRDIFLPIPFYIISGES